MKSSSVHLLIQPLQPRQVVGLARALVGADALEAGDAEGVAGAVARGLLDVLEVDLDDDLGLDLDVAAARRDDAGLEPRRQLAQRLFGEARADLAHGLEALTVAHGDDEAGEQSAPAARAPDAARDDHVE